MHITRDWWMLNMAAPTGAGITRTMRGGVVPIVPEPSGDGEAADTDRDPLPLPSPSAHDGKSRWIMRT